MSEDTATDLLTKEMINRAREAAVQVGANDTSYRHIVRTSPDEMRAALAAVAPDIAQAAYERGRADGAAEERERIEGLLQRAADGRAEYASSGGPDHQVATLRDEAQAFTNAARLCDDPAVMLGLVPSWRWTPEEDALTRGPS